jgi:hypothetical protein
LRFYWDRVVKHFGQGLPLRPELCRYSNSKYVSATELVEVTLGLPEYHVRKNLRPVSISMTFHLNESATAQLREFIKDKPLARWATVVVEGIVFVRKCDAVEIAENPPRQLLAEGCDSKDAATKPRPCEPFGHKKSGPLRPA